MIKSIEQLKTAGNMNGRDVTCESCNEPWEVNWIVEELTLSEIKREVIFDNYPDDPYGDNETYIVGLKKCRCCDD